MTIESYLLYAPILLLIALTPYSAYLQIKNFKLKKDKSKIKQKFDDINTRDIKNAYKEGMSEIATSVLHNIGNIITALKMRLDNCVVYDKLCDLQKIIKRYDDVTKEKLENNDLDNFLKNTDDGKIYLSLLPNVIEILTDIEQKCSENGNFSKKQLEKISEIITLQRSYTGESFKFRAKVNVADVVKDAITMQKDSFFTRKIKMFINLDDCYVYISRIGLSQAILNFLVNARESIDERINNDPNFSPSVNLELYLDKDDIIFQIEDNGVGIKDSNTKKLFTFGFSTKNRKSGFGMHHCNNFVRANNGVLKLKSEGFMKGATLIVRLPQYREAKEEFGI